MSAQLDQAYTDLSSAATTIASGDDLLKAFKYENAVTAYQAAAVQGHDTIGPEIGSADPSVGQAATIYGALMALQSHLASQATAQQAQALAKQQWNLYSSALRALMQNAPATPSKAIVVAPTAAVAPPAAGISTPLLIVGGLTVLGIGGFLYWRYVHAKENPVGDPKVGSALIAKGRSCRFEMVDGPDVSVSGGMLHDPSGKWWPKRSVLCGPFKARVRKAADDEYTGAAKHYLGSSHNANIGVVETPPKSLGEWEYCGEVDEIFYSRTGKKRPGRYRHKFNKGTSLATIIKGTKKVKLYRKGRFVRLELPSNAILDSRGFVFP
jgi:hypothetical protein